MKIAYIHYHLKRGGVTRVIQHSVEAMTALGHDCLVLAGEQPVDPIPCPVMVIPSLNYLNAEGLADPQNLARSIIEKTKEKFGSVPDIWHIHNHSLGKNGSLTGAVTTLADVAPLVLQIHDFAEDGRPVNYGRLRNQLQSLECLYPQADHIQYAVLNSRDLSFLQAAGFASNRLHLLPNAVNIPNDFNASEQTLKRPRGETLIVYPTRAIRRKNIGECLLLAAANPDFHFATTLHPKNPDAIPIYNDWRHFAKENRISFSFGLGENESFASIVNSASAIVTTSIAEGFGLAFLEPSLFNKSLFGRDLPLITGDFKEKGITFPHLYEALNIPYDWIDYDRLVETLSAVLTDRYMIYDQIPPKNLMRAMNKNLLKNGMVDFGQLPESFQMQVIRQILDERRLLNALRNLSPPEADQAVLASNRRVIEREYNLKAYGNRLKKLYEGTINAPSRSAISYISPKAVLDQFLNAENFKLLTS